MAKRASSCARTESRSAKRTLSSALLLALCVSGCGEELLIGSAYLAEAGTDAALFIGDAGADASALADGSGLQDAASPAVDAKVDANTQILNGASVALGSAERWLSSVSSLQLAFQPAYTEPKGTFIVHCPIGCVTPESLRDGGAGGSPGRGAGSDKAETFTGRYVLYDVGAPAGTVFGLLYTEDGTFTANLQIDWGSQLIGAPLDQIFIVFAPLGRFPFLPLRN